MSTQLFDPAKPDLQQQPRPADTESPSSDKLKRVFIATQGCQMNEYDSDRMGDLLAESHGYVRTKDMGEADLLLLNTCSIREKAQEKVFSELGRWRKLKDKNPDLIIGVGGCVASQEGAAIKTRAPHVDMVFGPQTLHRLPEMLDETQRSDLPFEISKTGQEKSTRIGVVDVSFPSIEKFDELPEPSVSGPKAQVSIMEGCSKYCSFCVVPYTRGEEVSRPLDDVLAEVASLAERGVKEINLLGQNVNGYRGATHDGQICRFSELLMLVSHIEGLERIRYTTSHPLEFTDDIIEVYAQVPKLVSHLHLPIQSASNRILSQMKRNHTVDIYIEQMKKLRAIRPDLHLSSDFIIGFPGETDAEFEETLQFARDLDFDHSYSFIYSKRPGTPAAELDDDVPLSVKKQRLSKFQAFIKEQTQAKTEAMVGTKQRVLIDRLSDRREGFVLGTSDNTRTVQIPGGAELIGRMAQVCIDEAISMHLVGGTLIKMLD